MPQFTGNISVGLSGLNAPQSQVTVVDDIAIIEQVSVPAAQPGTLTTRTNNVAGTMTMTNSGHGITTGQRIDLYWTGGQAYGAVAGTVSGVSVPIASVAGGSNLPVVNTAVNVGIPVQRKIAVTGDNCSAILFTGPASGYYVLDSSGADLFAEYVAANGSYYWYTGSGVTNPIAGGTVASVWISHGVTTGAQTMQAGVLTH